MGGNLNLIVSVYKVSCQSLVGEFLFIFILVMERNWGFKSITTIPNYFLILW